MNTVKGDVKALVKLTKLDKIWCSKTTTYNYDGCLDSAAQKIDPHTLRIKGELEKKLGDRVELYLVIKGASSLNKYRKELEKIAQKQINCIDFGDFNIWFNGEFNDYIFSDVKEVILPLIKTEEVSEKSRIYIGIDSKNKYYKLPTLFYPRNMRLFVNWLKKTKRINVNIKELWIKDEKDGGWFSHLLLRKNIKTDADIVNYINYATEEYNNCLKEDDEDKAWLIKETIDGLNNIQTLNITQEDVEKFIDHTNNRYKITI